MTEEWKDIEGFVGRYQVSNLGRIRSLMNAGRKREIPFIMKKQISRVGYELIIFRDPITKKHKGFSVHRLVANAFVENKNNLPIVNHKDQVRTNNVSENLEWCDHEYNTNYANANELRRKNNYKSIKVCQYDMDGKFIAMFNSLSEAEKVTGTKHQVIKLHLDGVYKQAGGYLWRRQ